MLPCQPLTMAHIKIIKMRDYLAKIFNLSPFESEKSDLFVPIHDLLNGHIILAGYTI